MSLWDLIKSTSTTPTNPFLNCKSNVSFAAGCRITVILLEWTVPFFNRLVFLRSICSLTRNFSSASTSKNSLIPFKLLFSKRK